MVSKKSPISRILTIALISGLISGILVTAIFWFLFSTPWFFLIIPAIIGWSIKKFANITADEVEADEKLESKVGWTCAGITLFFVLLPALVIALGSYLVSGSLWSIFLNFGFYFVCGFAVWFGHLKGVQAVVDSYYDSNLNED